MKLCRQCQKYSVCSTSVYGTQMLSRVMLYKNIISDSKERRVFVEKIACEQNIAAEEIIEFSKMIDDSCLFIN